MSEIAKVRTPIHFHYGNGVTNLSPPTEGRLEPVVRLAFPHTITPTVNGTHFSWGGDPRRKSLALIDTGADNCVIDKDLAQYLGFKVHADRQFTTSGVHGSATDHLYSGDVFLTDSRHAIRAQFFVADLRASGRIYDVILGMNFFQKGRLVMDFMANDFHFEAGT